VLAPRLRSSAECTQRTAARCCPLLALDARPYQHNKTREYRLHLSPGKTCSHTGCGTTTTTRRVVETHAKAVVVLRFFFWKICISFVRKSPPAAQCMHEARLLCVFLHIHSLYLIRSSAIAKTLESFFTLFLTTKLRTKKICLHISQSESDGWESESICS